MRPVIVDSRGLRIRRDILTDIADAQAKYEAGDWDGAEPIIRRLLRSGFAQPITYDALASVAQFQGKVSLALDCYRKALQVDPEYVEASDRLILVLDVQPETTAKQAQRARQQWWDRHGANLYARRRPHDNDRDPERPLRVGYVSGDFNFHSASNVFHRIVLEHSDAIQPFFYSSLPPEGYGPITNTYRVQPGWRDVHGASDAWVASRVRDDRIDILVDLSGYTGRNRLRTFCLKPAPIQITAWGYATGVGWPAMDVLFSDPVVIPHDRRGEHVERVVDLPCVLTYEGPTGMPEATPLPCLTQAPTFGAFHRSLKLNAEVLRVWVALLERLPESRLILKSQYCPSFIAWMRRQLAPVIDRVEILGTPTGRDDHMRALAQVDLMLDTWPQTAGVTACEAFWMGVPLVTLIGPRVIQRTTTSLLMNLGLPEFVAVNDEDYIDRASAWVTTRKQELATIRRGLRERFTQSPICAGYTATVEVVYRDLWREYCAKPVSIADARKRLELVCA